MMKIPDKVGVREIQDLFKKFVREHGWPCEGCPKRFGCEADVGCLQSVLTDFLFWVKQSQKHLSLHQKIILEALKELPPKTLTGEVYLKYKKLICEKRHTPLSLRRISSLIIDLAERGFLEYEVVSLGRYGRSKFITLAESPKEEDHY